MSLAIAPANVKVYGDIAGLLVRHAGPDILGRVGLGKLLELASGGDRHGPEDLADDLEKLGPTYIKIGQTLSTQLNVLPEAYMTAMSRLHDDVKPLGFAEIQKVIETELESPLLSVFSHIDTHPLGTASLGQVHRAVMPDGRPVAVKVQRPGIEAQIEKDMEGLSHVAGAIDTLTAGRYGLERLADYTRDQLLQELDYRREAQNLRRMRSLLKREPHVVVPAPTTGRCTRRVLVMDLVEGRKVTDLTPRELDGLDGERLARRTFKRYLEHILLEGFFHADPHPGNVLIDGENRLVMLDLGMVGRVAPALRERLLRLVLQIAEGRGEQVARTALDIGATSQGFVYDAFVQDISQLVMERYDTPIEGLGIGGVVLDIARICGERGVRIPPVVNVIGKTLLNLDQLGQALDPDFQPAAAVRAHAGRLIRKEVAATLRPAAWVGRAAELRRLAEDGPGYAHRVLENLAREDRGLKLDVIDQPALMDGFEKIANRITYGLMIAGLLIAGGLMAAAEIRGPSLFGVGWAPWLLFIAAGIGIFLTLGGISVWRRWRTRGGRVG